ncbi:MAG: hypothetical protein DWQ34_10255 [Planctomycetota bacterium]|nr:MAG: hypothetical protein DWQ29_15155 [Planctomycetota bacterium]REJ93603.1 MAG: hypothetical protein DWQ34_10255 [Planctomycetota bacterium]REK19937.1 MAG: hypothetical protein DWQ41_26785 [Planctomycetota bacterium]REK27502.1 MAG: hypothetical protein DWQ45_25800 [Planctomycetota bacterium]
MCHLWAGIVHRCFRRGKTIDHGDAWIAATALRVGAPLITNNAADFQHIDGLNILTSEANE